MGNSHARKQGRYEQCLIPRHRKHPGNSNPEAVPAMITRRNIAAESAPSIAVKDVIESAGARWRADQESNSPAIATHAQTTPHMTTSVELAASHFT
jgi:hypothetical protein